MTSVQIQCFLTAANSNSFTQAARQLYMSQPTLGRQIAALEEELGFALFIRGSQSCSLTRQGQVMYEGFGQLEADYQAVYARASQLAAGHTGRLHLGLLEGQLIDDRLSAILGAFRQKHPGIELTLDRYSFRPLLEALRSGALDVGITLLMDVESREEFSRFPMYSIQNELVFRRDSPLAARTGLTLADFAQETFVDISPEESPVISGLMLRSCQAAGFTPKMIKAPDLKTQLFAVEAGLGIAGFNQYHQVCNHPDLVHVSLPELPDVWFCAAWARDTGNPAVDYFLQVVQAQCSQEAI